MQFTYSNFMLHLMLKKNLRDLRSTLFAEQKVNCAKCLGYPFLNGPSFVRVGWDRGGGGCVWFRGEGTKSKRREGGGSWIKIKIHFLTSISNM